MLSIDFSIFREISAFSIDLALTIVVIAALSSATSYYIIARFLRRRLNGRFHAQWIKSTGYENLATRLQPADDENTQWIRFGAEARVSLPYRQMCGLIAKDIEREVYGSKPLRMIYFYALDFSLSRTEILAQLKVLLEQTTEESQIQNYISTSERNIDLLQAYMGQRWNNVILRINFLMSIVFGSLVLWNIFLSSSIQFRLSETYNIYIILGSLISIYLIIVSSTIISSILCELMEDRLSRS